MIKDYFQKNGLEFTIFKLYQSTICNHGMVLVYCVL